jgi:Zn-dependent oligopeptidase
MLLLAVPIFMKFRNCQQHCMQITYWLTAFHTLQKRNVGSTETQLSVKNLRTEFHEMGHVVQPVVLGHRQSDGRTDEDFM